MQTFLLLVLAALVSVLGWIFVELKAKTALRVGVGLVAFTCVACAAFLAGFHSAEIRSSAPQEHAFLSASMETLEQYAKLGDTNAVLMALTAYNQATRAGTNEARFYQAATELYKATGGSP